MTQEFDAQRDKWCDIAASLDRHGVVLVRRGLDPAALEQLLAACRVEYARRDALAAADQLPTELQAMHLKFRAISVGDIVVGGMQAPQILVTPMVQVIAALLLHKVPGIAFSSFRCARIGGENLVLPYHQDSRILEVIAPQLGPMPTLVNLWVPMHDCGVERPGLEVVNRPLTGLMPTLAKAENYYSSIGTEIAPEHVEREFPAADRWHPVCRAGDFMLFKGTTIHRTYVTPAMTSERISADIRLL